MKKMNLFKIAKGTIDGIKNTIKSEYLVEDNLPTEVIFEEFNIDAKKYYLNSLKCIYKNYISEKSRITWEGFLGLDFVNNTNNLAIPSYGFKFRDIPELEMNNKYRIFICNYFSISTDYELLTKHLDYKIRINDNNCIELVKDILNCKSYFPDSYPLELITFKNDVMCIDEFYKRVLEDKHIKILEKLYNEYGPEQVYKGSQLITEYGLSYSSNLDINAE